MTSESMFDVSGKSVLITGGSGGIGQMMAQGFAQAGAKVYINGRNAEALAAACDALAEFGEVHAIAADLGSESGVTLLADTLVQREPRLHILVNNAGTAVTAPFDQYPDTAWAQLMMLNVQAPFMLSQRLMPLLEAAAQPGDPARIINIGSVAALTTSSSNTFAYAPSKAAIHQLTRSLARELAPRNVLVNCIAPGFFPSTMTQSYLADEAVKKRVLKGIPVGHVGEPVNIAGLAIFLSSKASTYMTGNIIALDGGSSLL